MPHTTITTLPKPMMRVGPCLYQCACCGLAPPVSSGGQLKTVRNSYPSSWPLKGKHYISCDSCKDVLKEELKKYEIRPKSNYSVIVPSIEDEHKLVSEKVVGLMRHTLDSQWDSVIIESTFTYGDKMLICSRSASLEELLEWNDATVINELQNVVA